MLLDCIVLWVYPVVSNSISLLDCIVLWVYPVVSNSISLLDCIVLWVYPVVSNSISILGCGITVVCRYDQAIGSGNTARKLPWIYQFQTGIKIVFSMFQLVQNKLML